MQRGVVSFALMRLNYDFHILTERHQEPQQSVPPRITEILREALFEASGCPDTQQRGHLDLFETAFFHDPIDLPNEFRSLTRCSPASGSRRS